MTDAFHPDLPPAARVHHVPAGALHAGTTQSSGMLRLAAISGQSVGAERLWMGQTHVGPGVSSGNHHHGDSESAIYVVSGHPEFVFLGENGEEERIRTAPGDYVFVPPNIPHREENPDPAEEAVVVIARSTQEAIVVNVPDLSVHRPQRPSA
ncbi:cupin domain-containing protein [Kitasatospora sp. NPDC058190]|uniref:cupin domain-containing protein n=1 Tax=Kitasatospora sp. NPDC058190 TaxID=3346371 RepID=UPI0036DADD23